MARYGDISKTTKPKKPKKKESPVLFPVSYFVSNASAGSVIFAYMFPAKGKLRNVNLVISKSSTADVSINIQTEKKSPRLNKTVSTFTVSRGVNSLDNIYVEEGDCVKVIVNKEDQVDLEDLWISFFYQYGGDNV